MLSTAQLQDIAGGATMLRRAIEAEIMPPPVSTASMAAYMRLSEGERAKQRDLTAISAHLAQASALLHRVADQSAPIIDVVLI